jgi:hypothetical protein
MVARSSGAVPASLLAAAGYRVPKDLSRALGPGQLTLWPGLLLFPARAPLKLAAAWFFPHTSAPSRTIEWLRSKPPLND